MDPRIERSSDKRDAPYTGTDPYLFASYAREDKERVQPMLGALRNSGVRLWWDEGLSAGQSYADEIERRVRGSEGVIVFLSANAIAQKAQNWVFTETKLAKDEKKAVIPVRLDESQLPLDWKALVDQIQMVQAAGKAATDRAVEELRGRAAELRCRDTGDTGATTMPTKTNGYSLQHVAITALCVVVAVLLTVIFTRRDGPSASEDRWRGAAEAPSLREPTFSASTGAGARAVPSERPSAPEVPASYIDSIRDEVRSWSWSARSAADSGEVTLHWENCPGIEKMKPSNRMTQTGTIEQVARRTGLSARCCRFCYEIEFYRRMKNGEIPPVGNETGATTAAP